MRDFVFAELISVENAQSRAKSDSMKQKAGESAKTRSAQEMDDQIDQINQWPYFGGINIISRESGRGMVQMLADVFRPFAGCSPFAFGCVFEEDELAVFTTFAAVEPSTVRC